MQASVHSPRLCTCSSLSLGSRWPVPGASSLASSVPVPRQTLQPRKGDWHTVGSRGEQGRGGCGTREGRGVLRPPGSACGHACRPPTPNVPGPGPRPASTRAGPRRRGEEAGRRAGTGVPGTWVPGAGAHLGSARAWTREPLGAAGAGGRGGAGGAGLALRLHCGRGARGAQHRPAGPEQVVGGGGTWGRPRPSASGPESQSVGRQPGAALAGGAPDPGLGLWGSSRPPRDAQLGRGQGLLLFYFSFFPKSQNHCGRGGGT